MTTKKSGVGFYHPLDSALTKRAVHSFLFLTSGLCFKCVQRKGYCLSPAVGSAAGGDVQAPELCSSAQQTHLLPLESSTTAERLLLNSWADRQLEIKMTCTLSPVVLSNILNPQGCHWVQARGAVLYSVPSKARQRQQSQKWAYTEFLPKKLEWSPDLM